MDIAISTAAIPGRPSPLLITKEAVAGMKPGSVAHLAVVVDRFIFLIFPALIQLLSFSFFRDIFQFHFIPKFKVAHSADL